METFDGNRDTTQRLSVCCSSYAQTFQRKYLIFLPQETNTNCRCIFYQWKTRNEPAFSAGNYLLAPTGCFPFQLVMRRLIGWLLANFCRRCFRLVFLLPEFAFEERTVVFEVNKFPIVLSVVCQLDDKIAAAVNNNIEFPTFYTTKTGYSEEDVQSKFVRIGSHISYYIEMQKY